jgi:hypothetical protein
MTNNEKIEAVVKILASSDIVWSKYGNDTIQELAERIIQKVNEEEKPDRWYR